MSAPVATHDKLAAQADKMLGLKLSQLKKLAKKNLVPDDVIEAAAAGDEEDAKPVLVSLIFKATCLKAAPSPMRAVQPPQEQDPDDMFCSKCKGCIRIPGHEGPCVDQQCNEIFPDTVDGPDDEKVWAVEEEVARHKAKKQEIREKLEAERKAAAAARRQAEAEARQKRAAEEARKKAEEEKARKLAEEEAMRFALQLAEEEAKRKLAEEEAARKLAEEEAARKLAEEEEAARKLAEEKEAARELERAQRRAEEEAEMAEMDKRCVETFLECVKPCAWRDRVRTPLKGTNLYTKFMRPCRPAGTSVDVKDSSFRTLGNFLQFLEREGLLRLKPGESDPVVTQIRFEACSKYVYGAAKKERTPSGSPSGSPSSLTSIVSRLSASWQ